MTNQIEVWNLLYKIEIVSACKGLKMAKNVLKIANIGIFALFRPPRGIKTLQKPFSCRGGSKL